MPQPDLLRRQRALDKTMAKYRARAFAWGEADCVAMVRSHLVALGRKGLPKLPRYRSAAGAARALKAMEHETLEGLLDSLLPRIAPAQMLPGDLALMEGEKPFDALTICVGHKLLGWHEESEEMVVITALAPPKAAWRAL